MGHSSFCGFAASGRQEIRDPVLDRVVDGAGRAAEQPLETLPVVGLGGHDELEVAAADRAADYLLQASSHGRARQSPYSARRSMICESSGPVEIRVTGPSSRR